MATRAGTAVDRLFEFCLLGMVASGYFAVAGSGYLDAGTIVLTATALVLRALIITGVLRLRFPPTVITVVTLLYIGFYPVDYLFVAKDFLAATVHLVFFLAITKVLTAESERDYTYVKIIALLELLAACLLSGRLNFFAFLALYLIFAVGTFTCAEIRRSSGRSERVVRAGSNGLQARLALLGLSVSFGILLLTAGLFFFLPRTARAAFQHLVAERYHLPGFSNEITLGQIGEIKSQSATVMHVRFLTPGAMGPANLKWRGTALSRFDGKRWSGDPATRFDPIKLERSGLVRLLEEPQRPPAGIRRFAYEVHEKDFGADTLFFAGVPEFLRINVPVIRRSETGSVRVPLGINGGISYIAHAYVAQNSPSAIAIEPLTPAQRKALLELPRIDPRIPPLVAEMTAGASTPDARARAIEQHLRHDYGYTLTLLSRQVPDPLAHFLFERKKGHCEYFASAMAVMLRTVDIPARVVTGFQSGIYNPISGLQLIRTSDAHSWVEAYLPGRGWTTFDPTPPDPSAAADANAWTRISLYLDAADTFWQDWVLNYDLDHQLLLATRMQDSGRGASWMDAATLRVQAIRMRGSEFLKQYGAPLAAVLIALVALIFYGPAARKAWHMRKRFRQVQRGLVEASDATLLYERMLRALEKRGYQKPAWLTAVEFAHTIPACDLSPLVEDLTEAYHELRYGGRRDAGPRLLTLLEQLERTRPERVR